MRGGCLLRRFPVVSFNSDRVADQTDCEPHRDGPTTAVADQINPWAGRIFPSAFYRLSGRQPAS